MNEHEMDVHGRPVPDDPDAVDRDPYLIPEPDDEGANDRPGLDEEEEPQRFPGEEPPDSMIVGDSEGSGRMG
jgi:hypothetical protein